MRNIRRRVHDLVARTLQAHRAIPFPGAAAVLALAILAAGCESTSHDNIDKWMVTEKGPGKLRSAVRDVELDPDMCAHAAQNLIRMEEMDNVLEAIETMSDSRRKAVLDKLVPRLWEDARVPGEDVVPSPAQVGAKDALFDVRRFADESQRKAIDEHLAEWLTGGYFAGRARQGRHRGEAIMRELGPAAATRLLASANAVVAAPPDSRGARLKIEEGLLLGLAATGSPEAVEFILDLVKMERGDRDLAQRAFDALYQGYVDNRELFPVADSKALEPHLERLTGFAQDETLSNKMANDAIGLIGAVAPPTCIERLVELVRFPHGNENYTWVSAIAAIRCGKAAAIVPVAEALPRDRQYVQTELAGLTDSMAALGDARAVADAARTLLGSESWAARLVSIELIARLAEKGSASAEDAQVLRRLAGDKTVLAGWWGDQSDVPKRERKKEPRLGERAEEVAKQLDQ